MHSRWKILIILSFIILATNKLHAEDVFITINGKVVATPCTISTSNSIVSLGDLYTYNFLSPGSSSEWKDLILELSNCPTSTSLVTASFSGSTDISGYYLNQGTAKNIQIQLRLKNGEHLSSGASTKLQVNKVTNSVILPLQVRATTVNGSVSQGTISTVINVTYTYS